MQYLGQCYMRTKGLCNSDHLFYYYFLLLGYYVISFSFYFSLFKYSWEQLTSDYIIPGMMK